MSILHLILGLVAAQRVAELLLARRNTVRLLASGAHEVGRRHYPLFVALHTGWLLAMLAFVPGDAPPLWGLLALFLLLQACRLWVLAALGPFWTTRVITLPGAPLVRGGPYRFFRHPNYLVVTAEIACLPLAFGAWEVALAFSCLNALLLTHRIRVEETALRNREEDVSRSRAGKC